MKKKILNLQRALAEAEAAAAAAPAPAAEEPTPPSTVAPWDDLHVEFEAGMDQLPALEGLPTGDQMDAIDKRKALF